MRKKIKIRVISERDVDRVMRSFGRWIKSNQKRTKWHCDDMDNVVINVDIK